MIRVRFTSTPEGRLHQLSADGHAFYARRGEDIVCAAVSTLLQNLGHSLELLLQLPVDWQQADGMLDLKIDASVVDERSDLLFAAAILGLESLASEYEDYLTIEPEEKTGL